MIQINKTDLKTAIQWALGSRGIWTPEIEGELIIEITNLSLSQHDVSGSLIFEEGAKAMRDIYIKQGRGGNELPKQ